MDVKAPAQALLITRASQEGRTFLDAWDLHIDSWWDSIHSASAAGVNNESRLINTLEDTAVSNERTWQVTILQIATEMSRCWCAEGAETVAWDCTEHCTHFVAVCLFVSHGRSLSLRVQVGCPVK